MSTSTAVRAPSTAARRPGPIAGACLVLGGVAFFAGGAMHPGDSGTGSKIEQLYEMLVDPMWYPSHALLLAATVAFAIAILWIQRHGHLDGAMAAVTRVASVIAVVAAFGMTLHLLSALGAEAIADGEQTLAYRLQALNETVVDTSWGLGMAALALAGGLSRALGNTVTLALGLVGGLALHWPPARSPTPTALTGCSRSAP